MKKNNLNKILDTSYLSTDDIKWINNKKIFKKYIKIYYDELKKLKKGNNKINKKENNDEIEVLDFENKINVTKEEVIEILDFTKTIDVSEIINIEKAKEKAKKKIILQRNLLYLIITICVIGIIIVTFMLFNYYYKDNNNKDITNDINKYVTTKKIEIKEENIIDNNDLYSKYENLDMFEVDFEDLINTNKDTKGWIKVNGTKINYPFVQSSDNNYYLNHSYDKSYNIKGWVFLDYRCNIDNLKDNTILYAHGLDNYTMFGSLRNIVEKKWYSEKNNHIISISTPSSNMLWQVFSSYTIEPENYYIKTNFASKEMFEEFIDTIKSRSVYDYETAVNSNDKILTLSSCYDDNVRMVLHAKLIALQKR